MDLKSAVAKKKDVRVSGEVPGGRFQIEPERSVLIVGIISGVAISDVSINGIAVRRTRKISVRVRSPSIQRRLEQRSTRYNYRPLSCWQRGLRRFSLPKISGSDDAPQAVSFMSGLAPAMDCSFFLGALLWVKRRINARRALVHTWL